ncbi:succinylglutamate-semialdehyde dehydrogenase [Caulobacter vibrioides]|uniref:N-succinylglutamate 5-semialdehyde dehydrogenase 2 n=2 Tax=Caulobacter vibrioides TaxID=155892 RepID=ASTD2_CAUVC|nr:succinylglutamate-semialdehyde dehydrogenase [Caulobacter vibrioides]YP_002517052.1 succinylglutamic semialdehyde dehydrogenase [Caulobacter vibrioides NA1000]Q9A7W2.1 RecName: Full=N-succinylglutamate 5-semialdehyde dehydrogenase 2; AltName: Full=Succinylglutamic semialdehyde dehydrogenase 2; Short=SGSD 2 [Caulobacter vibrioides CB15]AAK23586.1 succinylglutamic semialdehyde dehydrogenase [Caulobacter vibrioides CB15]ACL95144.1 succinylglutamic semialdehyde dehydrogenase [Caulobacter vibrioi
MSGGLFIDGKWRAGQGAGLSSTDPATGEDVWSAATATPADVADAVAAARKAFPAWADRPREERIAILRRYKDILVERAAPYAEALSRETGKALWETRAELASMAGKVDLSIRAYDERTGVTENAMPFGRAVLRHRAHGVMAVLGPFNFPGHLPNGHIVPALLAGDTVVFKPSEETPLAGQLMVEALEAAGAPAGVVNLVQGGRETGQALIAQDIDGLLFTGSAAAGTYFRRYFADRPDVILALELGGNNPLVVWNADDAPEAVAALIVQSAFITTGQRCSCARRLIVPDDASGAAIIEATVALAERLVIGAWNAENEPFMGPLISGRAAKAAREVASATPGKTILALDGVAGLGDAFLKPGIVDVTGLETPDEELFAPLLQVRRVSSFDEALAAANATRYGLSAGLISNESELWDKFLSRIRAGVVNWNRPTTGAAGSMPFGGLGASGNHRPSAYYAADYCAYPVASFEASMVVDTLKDIKGLKA